MTPLDTTQPIALFTTRGTAPRSLADIARAFPSLALGRVDLLAAGESVDVGGVTIERTVDPIRLAALGAKFADPVNLLRGVLNAAILSRPPGATSLLVDIDGLADALPVVAGRTLGGHGAVWLIATRDGWPIVVGTRVLVQCDAIETARAFGVGAVA